MIAKQNLLLTAVTKPKGRTKLAEHPNLIIVMYRFSSLVFSLVIISSDAFMGSTAKNAFRITALKLSDQDDSKTTFVTSARKELAFDDLKGRFFETSFDQGECIPEDEFCVTDKETGELIRLTLEEKERIFLDALQVRRLSTNDANHPTLRLFFLSSND